MSEKKDNYWIPLADLMTVLMVIFLFMAISYMVVIKKKQDNQNKIFEEYEKAKISLFNELNNTFKNDSARWHLKLDKDLSIKFTDPQVLFDDGSSEIKLEFKKILSEFLPKYLGVVLQDKYKNRIAEIRIEGHTNNKGLRKDQVCDFKNDPYIDNMELSQNRARNVLSELRKQNCFAKLGEEKKSRLQYWLTANGLSFGRTVDETNKLSFFSGKSVDNDKSRRVEFRIVTTSDEIINQAINQIRKNP
jgi:outer membrane protein OmpA-like peptidoglycan-associated protein